MDASQGGSAAVIFAGAALGAPVSTTHVVASSVVGVGVQHRARHVRWSVVREIGAAWLITLPISAREGRQRIYFGGNSHEASTRVVSPRNP